MSQKTDNDYFGKSWQFNDAHARQGDSLSPVEPLDRSRSVPLDNFIPTLDTNSKIKLPPFEFHSQPRSDVPKHPSTTDENAGSPSSTKSFANPTPKLQIITDLRSGSNSLSSQTPTPYSDTLLSVQDSTASPPLQRNTEEPLSAPLRRSISEPQKKDRPQLSANLHSKNDRPIIPELIQPQSSIVQSARTPVTPMLARSSSRRKANAFVAHNPFVGHRHAHGAGKNDKQELTFDDIPTPGPLSHPFGADMEDFRGASTSMNTHGYLGDHQTLLRSHSRRTIRATDTNRITLPEIQVHTGEPRPSNLMRAQSYSGRTTQVGGYPSAEERAVSSSVQKSLQAGVSRNTGADLPDSALAHPAVVDQNTSVPNEPTISYAKLDRIDAPPSILRSGTFESNLSYSKDDPEKGSIDTAEPSPTPTLWSRVTRAFSPRRLRWRSAPTVNHHTEPEKSLTTAMASFVAATLPKQVYLHLLLRLPLLYFSRVSRIFEEADMTLPEIKRMALETPSAAIKWRTIDLSVHDRAFDVPLEYQRLSSTWEFFIDSVLREWKIFNIISGLLLSAILTILQIDTAAQNPLIRYTALFSLICSLISLLFGCMYIIRFGSMRKPYKAAEWALEARNKTMIWWNVWVLLAMPAIWLTWSIVLYIACIMAFAWQTTSQDDTPPTPLSPTTVLIVRVLLTGILGLGVVYGILIVTTFSRYGEAMDKAWKERIDEWADEMEDDVSSSAPFQTDSYTPTTTEESSVPHWRESYTPLTNPPSPWQGPVSPRPSLRSNPHVGLVYDGYPARVPESGALIVKNPGSNLGNGVSNLREKRRVRFRSPKESPAQNVDESNPSLTYVASADGVTPEFEGKA